MFSFQSKILGKIPNKKRKLKKKLVFVKLLIKINKLIKYLY